MKYLLFILIPLLLSCGANKKLHETVKDKSHIVENNLTKIDTSKVIYISDSIEIATEIRVREYDVKVFEDTIITYLKKEVKEKTSNKQGRKVDKKENGEVLQTNEIDKENDIKTIKKEEREPYDPKWIRYLFWIILLGVAIYAFFFIERKFPNLLG